MLSVGLMIEEHRQDIIAAWRAAVQDQGPAVLEFALPVYVHELARALRHGLPPHRAWERCAMLVRRHGPVSASRVVRELAALRRALWSVLAQHRRAVRPDWRLGVDLVLDETMAAIVEALTRLSKASRDPE